MTAARVCFVAAELGGAAGEGSDAGRAPAALARHGFEVHLLACSEGEEGASAAAAALSEAGVVVHRLDDLDHSPGATVQRYGGDDPTLVLGERALEALERLHREHRFDLVEFPAGAIGMRTVQAKRSGDAFADAAIAVWPQDPSSRRRAHLRTLAAPRELKLDYAERYASEHADIRLSGPDELPGEEAAVAEYYRRLLEQRAPVPARGASGGTVTVVVAHYNHDRYLAGALASLAAQTRPPDEVIVIDDGSTSEAALRVFAEQEERYPEWTFVRQPNAGPGPARNHGLELATGTCFLAFDSDNVATPTMVERLLRAMERNPARAATACHNLAFTVDADIEAGRFAFRYSPTGGPRVLACVENVYGDTCSIFRTEALRSVGGFEVNRWSPTEDWETFVKLAVRGLEIDVLPRPLFYYRTDAGGRLQALGADRATKLRLRAHLVDRFLSEATLSELERRQLFECMQAFDDFATEGIEDRLAEQRRWHDGQMADLDSFRESQLEDLRAYLEKKIELEAARAEAERTRGDAERQRAEAAEGELASLSEATSGWLLRRMVRWRTR